jgi:hypothetical protein
MLRPEQRNYVMQCGDYGYKLEIRMKAAWKTVAAIEDAVWQGRTEQE